MWAGLGLSTPSFRRGVDPLACPDRKPLLPALPSLPCAQKPADVRRGLTPNFPLLPEVCTVPRASGWRLWGQGPRTSCSFLPEMARDLDGGEGKVGEGRRFTDFCP